jgi:UDP-2-acetamido-3-amino-2,3-dideoxy-glucuronate N-acetyltransferase
MIQQSTPAIAVIGAGYWGKNIIRVLHELGALHTICTRNQATLHDLLAHYPGVAGTPSIDEVTRNEKISAVCIATPSHTHFNFAKRALEAGKDVLVEKPLCLSVKDGEHLVALAQQRGRILMVGHQLWYHPAVIKIHEMVAGGELGPLLYLASNRLNFGRFRGHEDVIWSIAPHDISLILGLVGNMPIFIKAHGHGHCNSMGTDSAALLLDFGSGSKAHVFVSRLHPFKEQRLVVVGEKQMAVFDDTAPWPEKLAKFSYTLNISEEIPNADLQQAEPIPLTPQEPLKAECEHFIHCIKTRSTPKTDGNEALRVVQVLEVCHKFIFGELGLVRS